CEVRSVSLRLSAEVGGAFQRLLRILGAGVRSPVVWRSRGLDQVSEGTRSRRVMLPQYSENERNRGCESVSSPPRCLWTRIPQHASAAPKGKSARRLGRPSSIDKWQAP